MKLVTLSEIAIIKAGYPFRGKIESTEGSTIRVAQIKDISANQAIDWQACMPVELTSKRNHDYLAKGDILLVSRGSQPYATYIENTPESQGLKAVASPHLYVISITHKEVLPEFIAWLLNQTPAQKYFEQNAEGTTTKSIRRTVLDVTPIALPSLEKQKTIVALAKAAYQHEKLLKQLIENDHQALNLIAQSLYDANA